MVLPWDEWEQEVKRLRELGVVFLGEPTVILEGTAEEQAKFYLNDPSNNVIEVKTYRRPEHTLTLDVSSGDEV